AASCCACIFCANQPPWKSILYSERAIKDSIPEFLLRLWNCYSFFTIYANIDGFEPGEGLGLGARAREGAVGLGSGLNESRQLNHAEFAGAKGFRPIAERSELDRWILSEL